MVIEHRAVGPIISRLRNFLLGREYNQSLRYEDKLSPRSIPPPDLPDGPHAKLSDNMYYTRDARRESKPPTIVADSAKRRPIAAGKSSGDADGQKTVPVPGRPYVWKS